ncbi:MAG: alkaline phosphatase family protein [Anaerolineaceae bacterium]|nr:alkaline phosphatase family protein [Anaerolineaceae bacterium]
MINLVPEFLPEITAHRLPNLDLGENAVHPYYHGYSLGNLPASICQWLGAPPFGAAPLKENLHDKLGNHYKNVILVLVDGLGLNWFEDVRKNNPSLAQIWDDMLEQATLAPLTSVVPSTTATALTTLWTGATPAEHGILGYEIWLKEYGVVANMIFHSAITFYGDFGGLKRAGFDPENFLTVPTLGPHMQKYNIQPYAFQHRAIANSGLSRMHMKGVNVVPCRTLEDQWYNVQHILGQKQDQHRYLYVYWSILDEMSHAYGADDPRVAQDFTSFSRSLAVFLKTLQAKNREDTLVLLTADHGHLPTPRNPHFELLNHPELMASLTIKPTCENRLPYLFVKPGCEAKVQTYVEQQWPGLFKMIPAEHALQAGLFGSNGMDARTPDRIGNWIVVPQKGAYWWWADNKNPLLGRHGGVSPTEMLVPLIAWKV